MTVAHRVRNGNIRICDSVIEFFQRNPNVVIEFGCVNLTERLWITAVLIAELVDCGLNRGNVGTNGGTARWRQTSIAMGVTKVPIKQRSTRAKGT